MIQADAPNQLGNERYRFDALDNLRQANMGSEGCINGSKSRPEKPVKSLSLRSLDYSSN
jgi:hypothetical protein